MNHPWFEKKDVNRFYTQKIPLDYEPEPRYTSWDFRNKLNLKYQVKGKKTEEKKNRDPQASMVNDLR